MGSKTRVVVTSKLEHLKRADKILLLHNGVCYFYGTFSQLQAQRPDFSSLLLGLEAYDKMNAERRSSILTETLRRVSVDETDIFRAPPDSRRQSSFRQSAPAPALIQDGHHPEKRKQSLILNPLAAARKFSFIGNSQGQSSSGVCGGGGNCQKASALEDSAHELSERKFSVVPEDDQVEEVLPRGNLYHHGLEHLHGQRRQSVLAFITNDHNGGGGGGGGGGGSGGGGQQQQQQHRRHPSRREQLQSSFRKKLSITPQGQLASELDIYARRLSLDSVFDISEEVDEEDMEVGDSTRH